jgi:hypothetical protein
MVAGPKTLVKTRDCSSACSVAGAAAASWYTPGLVSVSPVPASVPLASLGIPLTSSVIVVLSIAPGVRSVMATLVKGVNAFGAPVPYSAGTTLIGNVWIVSGSATEVAVIWVW